MAGGATWRSDGTAVHSSVEWFSSVGAYDILEPEPAPVAGSSTTIPLTYRGEAASVFNYGLGVEQRLGERVVLYGGVAHNQSAHVPERDTFAAWDLTDVTAGFTFDTGRAKIAFGVGYAWGSDEVAQVIVPPGDTRPTRRRETSAAGRSRSAPRLAPGRRAGRASGPLRATCSTRRSSGSGPTGSALSSSMKWISTPACAARRPGSP